MATQAQGLVITRVTLDSLNFTAIVAPANCNGAVLKNGDRSNDWYFRTNKDDPSTEDFVPAQNQYIIPLAVELGHYGTYRYPKGTLFGYARAAAGTGPLIVACVTDP